MDPLTWLAATAAGVAVGLATGLVPGLHANTLAAIALAAGPSLGEAGALALVAVATAHAFVQAIPATYLGVPDEGAILSVLPAHRLLLQGDGPAAVRAVADASLAGAVAAVLLLLPLAWALGEPLRLLPWLDRWALWIVAATTVFLVVRERSPARMAQAAAVLAASGTLGWVALRLPVQALAPVPASPLLPLLSGMFGAAGLAASWTQPPAPPPQREPAPGTAWDRRAARRGAWRGVAAAAWTAAVPGLTSAVAATVARAGARSQDPRCVLATLSAVNTAHMAFSLGLLWAFLRPRTGLALAVADLQSVVPGQGILAPGLAAALATLLAAALAAHAATLRLDRIARAWATRVPQRSLACAALGCLTLVVAVLSGWLGLAVYAAAATLALAALRLGARRIHLTGCLLVPALLRLA